METNTAARSIAAISIDMDRLAKRSADVKKLYGSKLRAYRTLEIELNIAKAAGDPNSLYLKIADQIKADLESGK